MILFRTKTKVMIEIWIGISKGDDRSMDDRSMVDLWWCKVETRLLESFSASNLNLIKNVCTVMDF